MQLPLQPTCGRLNDPTSLLENKKNLDHMFTCVDQWIFVPLWGKTSDTSTAGNPFLPTLPCCCLSFQAVLGKPDDILSKIENCLNFTPHILPMFMQRFRSLTSNPIAATSVDTNTEQALKIVKTLSIFRPKYSCKCVVFMWISFRIWKYFFMFFFSLQLMCKCLKCFVIYCQA